jgi:hypothetical protein
MQISNPSKVYPNFGAPSTRQAGAFTFFGMIRNLKRPSWGLVLFLIGLNIAYFLPVIFPTYRGEVEQHGQYRYYLLARVLIVAGAFLESMADGFWIRKRHPTWVAICFTCMLVMAILSLKDGSGIWEMLRNEQAYLWMLIVPAVSLRPGNWSWLLTTFACHAIFGIAHVNYMVFIRDLATRKELVDEGNMYNFMPLYMATLLLMLLPMLRGTLFKAISVCAFGFASMFSFFGGKRFPILMIPVALAILGLCSFRHVQLRKKGWGLVMVVVFVLGVGIAGLAALLSDGWSQSKYTKVAVASEQLQGRFTEKGDVGMTIFENTRWAEVESAIKSMAGWDWLIGRGFHAQWNDIYGLYYEQRFAIHNSFINVIYCGGPLLFLVIITPLVWTFRVLRRSHDLLGISCAAAMLMYYFTFSSYTVTYDTIGWLLFCLLLGRCAWSEHLISPMRMKD